MYDVEETAHLWIELAAGTRLAARLWRPVTPDPVPLILEYLPYRLTDGTAPRDATTHPLFASQGYACLRVDLAGSGNSDGLFDDEYSEQELSQGEEVIAWAAAQDWCDGHVGIIGISWGGFNGLQLAYRQPPALRAVVSVCSTVDRYADDIHYMGGCLLTDNFNWGGQMTAYMSRPPDPLSRNDWRECWLERLENLPFSAEHWLKQPVRNDFWRHGSICEDYQRLNVPVLAIGGWADAYVNSPDAIARNLAVQTAALYGPWEHKYPHIARINPTDFHGEVLGWFDAHLKGGAAQIPPMRAFIQEFDPPSPDYGPRGGRWVAEETWPSPNVDIQTKYLGAGKLRDTKGEGRCDIQSPCQVGLAAAYFCPGMRIGHELCHDQASDDELSVCLDTPPLTQPLELLGRPVLKIAFSCDKPVAQMAVRLCDVAPDGQSQRISYRCFNLTHHASHEHSQALQEGQTYDAAIELNMCGHRLKPGHRLRLACSTEYWPLIWPSPEPAKVTLDLKRCQLDLPVRETNTEIDPMPPGEPRNFPRLDATQLRKAASETNRHVDAGGQYIIETFDDFGRFRIEDHGLIENSQVHQRFAIHPGDPLSAIHEARWQYGFARGDWAVQINSFNRMTSTATEFHLYRQVTAFEGETEIFRKSWSASLPRNLL